VGDDKKVTTLKGASLKHNLLAIQSLYGDETLAKVRSVMPPEYRERLEHVTALDVLTPEIFGELHEAVRKVRGTNNWETAHAIGSEAARLEFGGIYRVLLRAVQYDTIWDRVERAWNHIVGRGAFKWIERRDDYAKADIVGVTNFHPALWHSAAGRAERLLLMSGAKSASVVMLEALPTRATFEAYWVR